MMSILYKDAAVKVRQLQPVQTLVNFGELGDPS